MAFLSLLSMVQSSVVWLGLAAGMVVCVFGVAAGTLTVGDTVLFLTMMQQLYVPLTYFGSYYRQVGAGRGGRGSKAGGLGGRRAS
jgi:ATP-binding cassette subfamily B (MDR/TAP) protein 6